MFVEGCSIWSYQAGGKEEIYGSSSISRGRYRGKGEREENNSQWQLVEKNR